MAKKPVTDAIATDSEVVEELHVSDDSVEYTDVTGQDDLPAGVTDVAAKDEDEAPAKPARKPKPAAAAPVEDDIPEELKGKTPAQLAKMYRDAQSVIGRQGSELGDLRRTADEYIKSNLRAATPKPAPAPAPEPVALPDDVEFFKNPVASVAAMIAQHPTLKGLEGKATEFTQREIERVRNENAQTFNAAHPDAPEVLADPEFRAWIDKSPIRQQMLLRAHKHYDFQAGNEVFSTWKELKAARTPPTPNPTPTPKPAAQRAAGKEAARVPTGGNAAPAAAGKGTEKIYRRADIVRLMENDPDRYAAMGDEITKAYAEGRVR